MNPVLFNEPFEKALPLFIKESALGDYRKKLRASPLITVSDGLNYWHNSEHPMAFDKWSLPIFPFNSFRAAVLCETYIFDGPNDGPTNDSDPGTARSMGVAKIKLDLFLSHNVTTPNWRTFSVFVRVRDWTGHLYDGSIHSYTKLLDDLVLSIGIGSETSSTYTSECHVVDLKSMRRMDMSKRLHNRGVDIQDLITDLNRRVYECLSKIAIDFFNPSLHLVSVCKKAESKSPEWFQQRQHFIFVHKNCPINQRDQSRKHFDPNVEIKRTAHSRRAHYRLLKSPRYKSKRGTLVFVRSAWVGPKEWEDASGQIYRIVDHPIQPKPGLELN